jgi:hypothetical protein
LFEVSSLKFFNLLFLGSNSDPFFFAVLASGLCGTKDFVMQRWAEMVLCCGADWGCVPQLWNRVVMRKWLNIGAGSGDTDFSADEHDTSEGETDREGCLTLFFSTSAPLFLKRNVLNF